MKKILNFKKFINEAVKSPERLEAEEKAMKHIISELKKGEGLTRYDMVKSIMSILGDYKDAKSLAQFIPDKLMSEPTRSEYGLEAIADKGSVKYFIKDDGSETIEVDKEISNEDEEPVNNIDSFNAFDYFNVPDEDDEDDNITDVGSNLDIYKRHFTDRNLEFTRDSDKQLARKLGNPRYAKLSDEIKSEMEQRPRRKLATKK